MEPRIQACVLAVPQSLHRLLTRLSWQMLPPPQSLQVLHIRLCWQMPSPPHSLHSFHLRFREQVLAPPHSLHRLFCRLCAHCPAFPPYARLPPPLLLPLSPSGAARFLLPFPRCSSAALLPPEPPKRPAPCPYRCFSPRRSCPCCPLLCHYPRAPCPGRRRRQRHQLPHLLPRPRPQPPDRPLHTLAPYPCRCYRCRHLLARPCIPPHHISLRSMMSLAAAVPKLAHSSAVPRTDSEQKPHAYEPS